MTNAQKKLVSHIGTMNDNECIYAFELLSRLFPADDKGQAFTFEEYERQAVKETLERVDDQTLGTIYTLCMENASEPV